MALQGRHRYIVRCLNENFEIHNESITENLVKAAPVLEKINFFFQGDGPTSLIFYHRVVEEGNSNGEHELIVSDGSNIPLASKAIYFFKTRIPVNDEIPASLDPTTSTDGALSFGVVRTPLNSLETVVDRLYKPMLDSQSNLQWGDADNIDRSEFMTSMDSIVANLQESIKSLNSGLTLMKPDGNVESLAESSDASSDPAIVAYFANLLNDWCLKIESYLDDSDRSKYESHDSGPDTEIEYWRRRMQRLTSITDQLKTRQCKSVIAVLTKVVQQPPNVLVDRQQVLGLLHQWRQVDVNITEASNEAKDNVKYLSTLERFMEPLYSGDPDVIIDILPAFINSLKMIHTIARFFNTTMRMTKLFTKITNQMVSSCKLAINGMDPPDALFDRQPDKVLKVLESCLRLNECYQKQYSIAKDNLLAFPKGKQFDFSEIQIFGKFDRFCLRIVNLMDIFSTIRQFGALANEKLEGVEPLLVKFVQTMNQFRTKGHNLLDVDTNKGTIKFENDFKQFTNSINELEKSLQLFVDHSFEATTSIEESLKLLHTFQQVLYRPELIENLHNKLELIFNNYGLELLAVQENYEKCKQNPPIMRNVPPVAASIQWCRHLLQRIEDPMVWFKSSKTILQLPKSKKIIKLYNRIAHTLISFEMMWYDAWLQSLESAKAGLHATLIIRHPKTGKLFVNFDREIFQLIKEAKCLRRMGIEVPESAMVVLAQESHYKTFYNDLTHNLEEYEKVIVKITPVSQEILSPHLENLELKLKPGLSTLTWTSMNIESFKLIVQNGVRKLSELIEKVNDIVENRIESALKVISRTVLVNLPEDGRVGLDDFVLMQETAAKSATKELVAKNHEIEVAVNDLVGLLEQYPVSAEIGPVSKIELSKLKSHYMTLTYRSLLSTTRNSLNALKKRVCTRVGSGFLFAQIPLFEVSVQLSVPSVRLSPSLHEIQRAINRSAVAVIDCSKSVYQWGQNDKPESERNSFFEVLGCDLEIIKVALLLTGALHGTKSAVVQYLVSFKKYDWLWKEDKDLAYKKFVSRNPNTSDFEVELKRFLMVEKDVEVLQQYHSIGALSLNTTNLKLQLRNESRQWKIQYSTKVHHQARSAMQNLVEYIKVTNSKLRLGVKNIDNLRYVMNVLREIRERESSIELEITPILDLYTMLEKYLPGGLVEKEELDQQFNMRPSWRKMVNYAETVADTLSGFQKQFKMQLVQDVKNFSIEVIDFRNDFEKNGPSVRGISPSEAVERLSRYTNQLSIHERKMDTFCAGEELFALQPTQYPELNRTKREVALLDQLYSLYMDIIHSVQNFRLINWQDLFCKLSEIDETFKNFEIKCKKLPKKLKEWKAYFDLKTVLETFQEILPLLELLTKPSIKPRHWSLINHSANIQLPYESELFCLGIILDSNLILFKDEIEDICEGADKQQVIETKLGDVKEMWDHRAFTFVPWKGRPVQILSDFVTVVDELEETTLSLQSLLSTRHVTPFKDQVQQKLTSLSDTADVLELWIKVQLMWTSLESVFTGGDIAKQMPAEAKKFAKIDKDWLKVMARACETRGVVECTSSDLLKNTLPVLFAELEKCQKSLEGFLEQKRIRFPRFYFVSNSILLLILSQGSNPKQMQPFYEKVFDSISRVDYEDERHHLQQLEASKQLEASGRNQTHSQLQENLLRQNSASHLASQDDMTSTYKNNVISMRNKASDDEEIIDFFQPVKTIGNIEEWLAAIEKEMRVTMKKLCEKCADECRNPTVGLREFIDKSCAQFALLGIQFRWTDTSQSAIERSRTHKQSMLEANRFQTSILQELSSWCLTDLKTNMNRLKIETLVTTQVHQKEVFNTLFHLSKERKGLDIDDFDWLKQCRCYWKPQVSDIHGTGACMVSICDVSLPYSYEYLGCKERLVITTLTDRCYIALSQAIGMCLGGAPAGPAGTGKTETVKDLGRTLGLFVVVINCTDQQRFTDMAKIFKGLCQAGLWACFDEFNRIELPVLSVVAQQVLAITSAKRANAKYFLFPGDNKPIALNSSAGYFITMNPGYAGRQSLPENLKSLFRGVAMMSPDREIIMKVKLCSMGYQNFIELAKKFNTLYLLCEQLLSKQKHYDFGLRNILSILRSAGLIKRIHLNENEDVLMMKTLRDMNLSKLISHDVPIFISILNDLFPEIDMINHNVNNNNENNENNQMIKNILTKVIGRKSSLINHESWTLKVLQLYNTILVRHGVMTVGSSGSGKSTLVDILAEVLMELQRISYKKIRLNPKALTVEDLFGQTDRVSSEWVDGVFAAMWSKFNDRNRKDRTWMVCDGPVDTSWIENLNTVLDDNKILTLANGDRIPMTENVKLLFECENLVNASPATVSRAGIIYVSESDLDWFPILQGWLNSRPEHLNNVTPIVLEVFTRIVGEYKTNHEFGHLFKYIKLNCHSNINLTRMNRIQSSLNLLTGLLQSADLSPSLIDLNGEIERLCLFSIYWGIGGTFNRENRIKFDLYIRNYTSELPISKEKIIFDMTINFHSMEFEEWKPTSWNFPISNKTYEFSSLLIPTKHSEKSIFLLTHLNKLKIPVLLMGDTGTAKTTNIELYFKTILSNNHHNNNDNTMIKRMNFSSLTTPLILQSGIEAELEKKGGKNFGPPFNKKMILFIDDMSMPEPNCWNDQPTLELLRHLMERNSFCFLEKDKRGEVKIVNDLSYISAMGSVGGGKNDIPNRLKRHFFIFNIPTPSSQSLNAIYGQILNGKFPIDKTPSAVIDLIPKLPDVTVKLWQWLQTNMLPSPSKFHYVFSLRELSRVFEGVLRLDPETINTGSEFAHLWRHECERAFCDKLSNLKDKEMFKNQLDDFTYVLMAPQPPNSGGVVDNQNSVAGTVATTRRGSTTPKPAPNYRTVKNPSVAVIKEGSKQYVNFLRENEYDDDGELIVEAPLVYEDAGTLSSLKEKTLEFLTKYNQLHQNTPLTIVLFDDAIKHLVAISRVLGMPRGNLLLVGIGGSGKQSLSRLASYIANYYIFQITLIKGYNLKSLFEDFRELYKKCGPLRKKSTFIISDCELIDENFLEVINSFLTTGEVPNLFSKDEMRSMASDLRPFAIKERSDFEDNNSFLLKYFIECVRSNLHVVLCMSPLHMKFSERCRKFPSLLTCCSIDWFLPLPQEALITVSKYMLKNLKIENDDNDEMKENIYHHTSYIHCEVVETSQKYLAKMRRTVYQTSKDFISFLECYLSLYNSKLQEIELKATRVSLGLDKLEKGAEDVESMKVGLAAEELKLRAADEATTRMLGQLQRSSMNAKKEADAVSKIKELCIADANRISGEKLAAEEDLAKAQPFVEEAERAVHSVKPNDLNELKKLQKPSDIIKLIFDCVGVLKKEKLNKVELTEITLGIGKDKRTLPFFNDSFKLMQAGMLSDTRFLQSIFYFNKHEKDLMNDETMEFLAPYLDLEGFTPIVARNASKAAEGLCVWIRAMNMYHDAAKMVKPKLEALRLAEAQLADAQLELDKAQAKLDICQDVLDKLKEDFEEQMASKKEIAQGADRTRLKMEQATALIEGLAGERERWTEDSIKFEDVKSRLVGDVALSSAFLTYLGPFNETTRDELLKIKFIKDLENKNIPTSNSLDLSEFLIQPGLIGDWFLEGLPSDSFSIQNGILATHSIQYPFFLDPQGQALSWILKHELERLPTFKYCPMNHPKLRERLEYCLMDGFALILTNVDESIHNMLTPVLEKRIITKAKSKYIKISDKLCEYDSNFTLYLSTRLSNPRLSPEDQAKTTVIEFTVTQQGLEEQLLGLVMQAEQRQVEEQLEMLLSEVAGNTKALLSLDFQLLARLSANEGNLLEDEELLEVLADTKEKAIQVHEKLKAAASAQQRINEKREQYRPIAIRGSILYFSMVDMFCINHMYQTSLHQFHHLFDLSMTLAEKSTTTNRRVYSIIESLTYAVYRYVNLGLYAQDKIAFKLNFVLKMLVSSNCLTTDDVSLLLKCGSLSSSSSPPSSPLSTTTNESAISDNNINPFSSWLPNENWKNVLQVSAHHQKELLIFRDLNIEMIKNEAVWRDWYEENDPETIDIPHYHHRLNPGGTNTVENAEFLKLLLIRTLREDRFLLAVSVFIRNLSFVIPKTVATIDGGYPTSTSSLSRLPALGPKYAEPITDTIEDIFAESNALIPILYLLSSGADPTEMIESLAKRKRREHQSISMGQGQDSVASRAISFAINRGSWILLQNCHLGLELMSGIEDMFSKLYETCHSDFRLFMTTEPHVDFPIGLLQMSTKVTNEPPKGLRAGMLRTYSTMVDQDRLDRVETSQWRSLVFALCFLHSSVQVRRKYGALGWCVPYEFNDGDLLACLAFLEKHLNQSALSWPTLQYMVSEVQYGGKITDEMDRKLFTTYAESWLCPFTLAPHFTFSPDSPINTIPNGFAYGVPDCSETDEYIAMLSAYPEIDSPEVFGLHPNADMTYRFQETQVLIDIMIQTQPKQIIENDGKTREEIVLEICSRLRTEFPIQFDEELCLYEINDKLGGISLPINIFLMQEINRFDSLIQNVLKSLEIIQYSIKGEIVITEQIEESIQALYHGKVPNIWKHFDDEFKIFCPLLNIWFTNLLARNEQIKTWLSEGKPNVFWIGGFFNPIGFLTGIMQEVTKDHRNEKWSLDNVVLNTTVSQYDQIKQLPKTTSSNTPKTTQQVNHHSGTSLLGEGALIYGLVLDGAAWNRGEQTLTESLPKTLFAPMPFLSVTVVLKSQMNMSGSQYGTQATYDCPVYKNRMRTGQFYIFSASLPSREKKPSHWALRGAALLCSTD